MPQQNKLLKNGTRIGRLEILYLSDKKLNNGRVYHCRCDCGNECDVRAYSLRSGQTQSCGCLAREKSSERLKNKFITDLTGQKFGKLTVKSLTDKRINGGTVWLCECECGNLKEVARKQLITGDTLSCGCLKSKGELIIKNLLLQNNIPFKEQQTFDNLLGINGGKLKFDFFINDTYLIEFDGEQHYRESTLFSHDNLIDRQENDRRKNEFAKNNNIPLIRIPYYKIKTLTIDDLIL